MKISAKGVYGLSAMVDIAANEGAKSLVTASDMSERQNISKNYLEQVLMPLRASGLIKGTKGSVGGYTLTCPPEKITVGQILQSLEGPLFEVGGENNSHINKMLTDCVWNRIDKSINDTLDSITLEDLVNEYKKSEDNIMYYI